MHGGFGFLFQASGFRISESLLDVLPEDPYWMSLAAGLVNTLTVALAALPLATLLGVALGLARLSPDPVASRLAAVIIAPLRNTPVLLQLFVWYGLLLRLPDARQAAAAVGAAVQSRTGAAGAARLAAASGEPDCRHVDRGLGDSTPAARDGWTRASRTRSAHPRRALAGAGRPAARLDLPARAHRRTASPARTGLQGGWQPSIEFATLVIGLSVFHAAYIADIVRASVRAVPAGLVEAGQALALSRLDILRLVVAPNAARVALPPYATSAWR